MRRGRNRRPSYQRDDLGWLGDESVCQLLVEFDQVADVDIARELFQQSILFQLVSIRSIALGIFPAAAPCPRSLVVPVDKLIFEPEAVDEGLQLLLQLKLGVLSLGEVGIEDMSRVHRLMIHFGVPNRNQLWSRKW